MNDSNEKPSGSEKMMTWLLSALGVALIGVGIVGYFMQGSSSGPEEERPTVSAAKRVEPPADYASPLIVITVPNLRADVLEQAKKHPDLAPNFSKLVRQSVYFSHAQAASSNPLSGTVSALTGTYPSLHQIYWMPFHSLRGKRVDDQTASAIGNNVTWAVTSLPHYFTVAFCQDYWIFRTSVNRGWTHWFTPIGQPNFTKVDAIPSRTPTMVNMFLNIIKTRKETRQLYWVHFDDTEYPVLKPEMVKPYLSKGAKLPSAQQLTSYRFWNETIRKQNATGSEAALVKAMYWAAVSYWDSNLGTLIDGLKEMNLYDNATIVFAGTSGFALGEKTFTPDAVSVPLLIKMKGNQNAGKVVKELVSTASVAPTMIELGGYQPGTNPTIQVKSLLPMVQNPDARAMGVLTETLEPGVRKFFVQENALGLECQQWMSDSNPHPDCQLFDLKLDTRMEKPMVWSQANEDQRRKIVYLKDKAIAVLRKSPNPFSLASAAK